VALLILGAALFLLIHLLVSGTAMRAKLVTRFGLKTYLRGFSIASALGLGLMIFGYAGATYHGLWSSTTGARHGAAGLMLIACIFFAGSFMQRNPTTVGMAGALREEAPAKGMLRITRHPFLWSVVFWSIAHLAANGDLASVVLFGTMLILGLIGPPLIDRKLAAERGADWERYAAVTSVVPFAAILTGRNKFSLAEIGWKTPVVGIGLYAAMMFLHSVLFGVTPLP
jgi:uncharacterized membrane protein